MKSDRHEEFQQSIDERVAAGESFEREDALGQHLQSCEVCRQYLSTNQRVIDSLDGFVFEVDPALTARVNARLQLRTHQFEAINVPRSRSVLVWLVAAALTVAGSCIDLQIGDLLSTFFNSNRAAVQHALLDFWIGPSILLLLLFPMLPLLLTAGKKAMGRVS